MNISESSWTACTNCGHSLENNIHVNPILPTSTPLQELLSITGVPSASEAAQVRIALEQTKSDMEKLDEEIRALESALYRLLSNREVLEKRSQHLVAVISPIRRLPLDILVQIFVEISVEWNKADLMALCHVSRLWRATALSTSSLWTRITVCFPERLHAVECQAVAVQHWLTYSRDSPLYVKICGADVPSVFRNAALEFLLLHSHRWRDVTLALTFNEMTDYFRGVKGRLGRLSSLKVRLSGVCEPIDYFEDAPSLRTVTMTGFIGSHDSFSLSLPWNSLTHLKATSQSGLAIVPQCSSLVSWDLALWEFSGQPTRILVDLPHLRSLKLSNYTRHSLDWFYDTLSFPMLFTLELYDPCETHSHHFASFLSRSSHALERLLLRTHESFNLTACSEAAPHLKHLIIKTVDDNRFTVSLQQLSFNLTSSTTLFPELESMEFVLIYRPDDIPSLLDDTSVAMILSRLSCKASVESFDAPFPCHAACSRLRSIVIVIHSLPWLGFGLLEDPFQDRDIGDFLRFCQDGGVDVSVTKMNSDSGHSSWQIRMT